jgi:PPOX class probable F420-dependent enzyme
MSATAPLTAQPEQPVVAFAGLEGHKFVSLTTFRRSGEAVATPVWFASDGEALYVVTDRASGKVKRIRRNGAVRLAPCTHLGRPLGPAVDARARVLCRAEEAPAQTALACKYGWMFSAFGLLWRLQRKTPVFLELVAR